MSKTFIFAFALGAAIGSVVTWKVVKTKYEKIVQEEIDSMEEYFSEKYNADIEPEEAPNGELAERNAKPSLAEYAKIISENSYTNRSNNEKEKGGSDMTVNPYVIPPDEVGEVDGYDIVSLNYFADGVLTDDWLEPIEDVDGLVGLDSLEHFGEFEDDSVYVRNDATKTDYEILRDVREFSSLEKATPPEDE